MQMLNTKLFFWLTPLLYLMLFSTSTCSANTRFIDQFQISPLINEVTSDRIASYYSEDIALPLEQQKTELFELNEQLESIAREHSNKAVYWFIKGLLHKNIASYYTDIEDSLLATTHINSKNMAYKKAIELSSIPNNQLSAAIFSTMKHGLPQDLKIQATQNELSMGGNGEDDSYYWYLHWSNIDQLEKAGRKEDALEAYKKMQIELKQSNMDMSIYDSLTKKIESETLKKSSVESPPSDTAVKKINIRANVKKEKKENTKPLDKKYVVIFSIILISVISIVIVMIYEVMQKQKKLK